MLSILQSVEGFSRELYVWEGEFISAGSILESCDCVIQYVKEVSNMLSARCLALRLRTENINQVTGKY